MTNLGKELQRYRGEAEMDRSALMSPKAKSHRLSSDIEVVRYRSKG